MPSLIDHPSPGPRGQVDAADHQGDEDGRRVASCAGRRSASSPRARTRSRRCACCSSLARASIRGASAAGAARRDRAGSRSLLIVITADRGLCGSFNTNILKEAGAVRPRAAPDRQVALGADRPQGPRLLQAPRLRRPLRGRSNIFAALKFSHAQDLAQRGDRAVHRRPRSTACISVYNEFKSVMQQRVVVERLLPIPRLEPERRGDAPQVDYLYEPSPDEILDGAPAAARRDPDLTARCSNRRPPSTPRA